MTHCVLAGRGCGAEGHVADIQGPCYQGADLLDLAGCPGPGGSCSDHQPAAACPPAWLCIFQIRHCCLSQASHPQIDPRGLRIPCCILNIVVVHFPRSSHGASLSTPLPPPPPPPFLCLPLCPYGRQSCLITYAFYQVNGFFTCFLRQTGHVLS